MEKTIKYQFHTTWPLPLQRQTLATGMQSGTHFPVTGAHVLTPGHEKGSWPLHFVYCHLIGKKHSSLVVRRGDDRGDGRGGDGGDGGDG